MSLLCGPRGAARPLARTVILSDAAIEVPQGGHYEAKTLTLIDPVSLDPAMVAGLGSDNASAVRALGGLSAARVDFENYRYAFPDRARHGFAEHISVEAIGSGRIGRVAIRALAADAVISGGQAAHYEVDKIEASGIDIAASAALLDQGPEALTDQTYYAPAETVTWDGMHTTMGLLDATVRHAEARGTKLRRIATAFTGDVPVSPDRLAQLVAAVAFDKVEYDGLDARIAGKDAAHVTLDRLAVADVVPGRIGKVALESLAADVAGGRVTLGSVALDGLSYQPRSAKARASLTALGFPSGGVMPDRLFFQRFALRDLASEATGRKVLTLKAIDASMEGSIALTTAFDFKVGNFTVDLSRLPPSPYGWSPTDLGITELVLDVDMEGRYDPAAKTLEVPRYAFVLPGLGSLIMTLSLGDLTIDANSDDPVQALQHLIAATLRRFEIRYEDDSLANRLLAYSAKRSNQDLDTFRTALIAQLETQARAILIDTPRAQMLDAVIAFLKAPKAITILVEPPKPVTLATLSRLSTMNPNDVPKLLGLSIR